MTSKQNEFSRLLSRNTGTLKLCGIYRMHLGKRQGQKIWIVDGDKVFASIYSAFVMGGNDQRYRFNPHGDVWIDDRIGVEELRYTIEHELLERKLMLELGWSYARAHKAALELERKLRARDRAAASKRNRERFPGFRQPVYRALFRTIAGVKVWIVDGPLVRERLDGDFCFGGHHGKYGFIPPGEIWLDSAMPVVRALLQLEHDLTERREMAGGMSYSDAYPLGLLAQHDELVRQQMRCRKHEAQLAPVRYGTRERGVRARS